MRLSMRGQALRMHAGRMLQLKDEMSNKRSVPNRQYTQEFKVKAIRLAESIGGKAAAKSLGVPQSLVTDRMRTRKASPQVTPPTGHPSSTLTGRKLLTSSKTAILQ